MDGPIDAGAEEELFRELGQRAAAAALARRWEEAGAAAVGTCCECGEKLQDLGIREKEFKTLCGPIVVRRRMGYCKRCHRTATALDERLNADDTGITPGLQRVICRTALEMAYEPTVALLKDTLGFTPCSAREIERIADRHGRAMEKPPNEEISAGRRRRKKTCCLAMDGTMIPGLPDTREHRLIWHEVKLAAVVDAKDIELPFYMASTGNAEVFGARLWEEFKSRGMDGDDLAQIMADGAPWIWNLAELHFPGVPQLLDLYHAAEHLHKTAKTLWPDAQASAWCEQRLKQLRAGELDDFFKELQEVAQECEPVDSDSSSPKKLLNYFESNRCRLGYAKAIENNLPVGSGVIESAGRHIVQQRLKQSGMRWSLPGAQAILNLRARHRSGQFEQYWENYAAA